MITRINLIYIILFISLLSDMVIACFVSYSFSLSPSISSRELTDDILDWFDITNATKHANGKFYSDINGITYFSDGKSFNSTIWTGGPLDFNSKVAFGVLIDVYQEDRSSSNIDYVIQIQNNNGTWIQSILI